MSKTKKTPMSEHVTCVDDVGVATHTGLRKLGQTKVTHDAWVAVRDLPPGVWSDLCKAIWKAVQKNPTVEAVKKAAEVVKKDARPASHKLVTAFDSFEEDDWCAFCGYLLDL